MQGEKFIPIGNWDLAFSKKAGLKDVEYDSGMHLVRMTIREGTRITDVNFHKQAALEIGEALIEWANRQPD